MDQIPYPWVGFLYLSTSSFCVISGTFLEVSNLNLYHKAVIYKISKGVLVLSIH